VPLSNKQTKFAKTCYYICEDIDMSYAISPRLVLGLSSLCFSSWFNCQRFTKSRNTVICLGLGSDLGLSFIPGDHGLCLGGVGFSLLLRLEELGSVRADCITRSLVRTYCTVHTQHILLGWVTTKE